MDDISELRMEDVRVTWNDFEYNLKGSSVVPYPAEMQINGSIHRHYFFKKYWRKYYSPLINFIHLLLIPM